VGSAISEDGGGDIAIITAGGYRFLFEDILQWALENWEERGPLSIEITARQALEEELLEQNGFEREVSFSNPASRARGWKWRAWDPPYRCLPRSTGGPLC
jgi:hypothetical protein